MTRALLGLVCGVVALGCGDDDGYYGGPYGGSDAGPPGYWGGSDAGSDAGAPVPGDMYDDVGTNPFVELFGVARALLATP